MGHNEFIFYNKRLGVRFYVKDGSEIIIDENHFSDPKAVSVYLQGSILSAALYMRGIIPMHASSVLTDKGAVLFAGISGSGKSTIANALQQRGYSAITDDVTPLFLIDNELHTYPGSQKFKLWQDSIKNNGLAEEEPTRIRDGINKFYIEFNQLAETKPYKISKIYHMVTHNKNDFEIIKKNNISDKLRISKKNLFRSNYAKGLKKEKEHFEAVIKLAHLPISTIIRPHAFSNNFSEFVDRISTDLLK